jgi:hypothetical protein
MPDTTLLDAALDYLAAGMHILALTEKRPNALVHGDHWSWEDSIHGKPTTDEEVAALTKAFTGRGTTGIAILIPPQFYVADVDTDRAADLLLECGYEATDETVAAQTKNGLHVWFWDAGADRNRWLGDGKEPNPGRTLLFKGFGGYVVAPPSAHFDANGQQDGTYKWITPFVVDGIAHMPDMLPDEVRRRFRRADAWTDIRAESKEQVSHFTMEPVEGVSWWLWEKKWTYNIEGLKQAIINAADGNQNNVIHWAACVCRDEGVPREFAMRELMEAARLGNHPLNRAQDTIRGAYKRERR